MSASADNKSLFVADFVLTERDLKLRKLARQYVVESESYDRTVCTGPVRNGEVMPMGHRELYMVNRHASRLLDRIVADNPGFTRDEIMRASARMSP